MKSLILSALVAISAATGFAKSVKYKAQPFIRVTGESMKQTMPPGSMWFVQPVKMQDVKTGDVIIFKSIYYGGVVVHRVVFKGPDYCVTRGDNNPSNDPYLILEKDLCARVVAAPSYVSK